MELVIFKLTKMKSNKIKYCFNLTLCTSLIIIMLYYFSFINLFSINNLHLQNNLTFKLNNCIDANKVHFSVFLNDIKYPKLVPLYENKSIDFQCLNSSQNKKTILLWTKFKGQPLPHSDYMTGHVKPFESLNCPVTNCELTYDRTKINQSDLVLFHLRNKVDYIPKRAKENQRFVHVVYESQGYCHFCKNYANTFNYTAYYGLNSDYTSIYWSDAGN